MNCIYISLLLYMCKRRKLLCIIYTLFLFIEQNSYPFCRWAEWARLRYKQQQQWQMEWQADDRSGLGFLRVQPEAVFSCSLELHTKKQFKQHFAHRGPMCKMLLKLSLILIFRLINSFHKFVNSFICLQRWWVSSDGCQVWKCCSSTHCLPKRASQVTQRQGIRRPVDSLFMILDVEVLFLHSAWLAGRSPQNGFIQLTNQHLQIARLWCQDVAEPVMFAS